MESNNISEVLLSFINGSDDILVKLEINGHRFWKIAADITDSEVNLVMEDLVIEVIVETVGGGTIHHRVLTHESCGAILIDDELEGLVEEAVLTVSVPVLVRTLLEGNWRSIV
jgi:hypothetical protein